MMRKVIYIAIICLFYGCGTLKVAQSDMVGEFYKKEASKNTLDISYNLKLQADNTFLLSMKTQDANPECKGQWELKDNHIYLKCEESENVGEILSSGHMKEKSHKLEIVNRNRIKFKDVVLKRK